MKWIYLCSDPRKLEMTLRYLPELNVELCVIYCSHFKQVTHDELFRVMAKWAPKWLAWHLFDMSTAGNLMPAGLQRYYFGQSGSKVQTLGVKLVLPLAFTPPFVYTDDDVLLLQQPMQHPLGYGNRGSYRFKGEHLAIRRQLSQAFELPELIEEFDQHVIGAGVWYIPESANWTERLQAFSELPYVQTMRGREFFCLDQRFITAFGMEHNWQQVGLPIFRRTFFPPSKLPRNVFDCTFLHYGSGSNKGRWLDMFEANLA